VEEVFIPFIQPGHKIGELFPLFSKIDEHTVEALKKKFAGK